jgi:hypothetical protein
MYGYDEREYGKFKKRCEVLLTAIGDLKIKDVNIFESELDIDLNSILDLYSFLKTVV